MNGCSNMAVPSQRYHRGYSSNGAGNHQYYGQHPSYHGYPAIAQNQWHQYGYSNSHNRKPLTCGPCNRTFYSQQRMDEHLKDHVDCPFPECKLSAHIKVIDQHINNQHMLINFEALQIDDETWIAERKKRFPTTQRAEIRRVAQMEKLKRGEKLGVNKKPFNNDKRDRNNKRGRDGKQVANSGLKNKNISGEKVKDANWKNAGETKTCAVDNEEVKNHSDGVVEAKETHFEDKIKNKKRLRLENPPRPKPSIDVDLYESDEEILGVRPFKGTRHFYESIGELNYFSLTNLNKNSPEKEFVISDDEEWEEEKKDEGKMILGGALGSLMGSYSDSEEEKEDETTAGPSIDVKKETSATANKTLCSRKAEDVVNQSVNEEGSKTKAKRRPRTHNKKGKKPSNIQRSQRRPRRRKHLLERLLQADIIHERNLILQCVRYIVENNFFDKPVVETTDTKMGDSRSGELLSSKNKCNSTLSENSVVGSSENRPREFESNSELNKDSTYLKTEALSGDNDTGLSLLVEQDVDKNKPLTS